MLLEFTNLTCLLIDPEMIQPSLFIRGGNDMLFYNRRFIGAVHNIQNLIPHLRVMHTQGIATGVFFDHSATLYHTIEGVLSNREVFSGSLSRLPR